MCQEVFQLVQNLNSKSVETQLAVQCSPLITGKKISNLFIIPTGDEKAMRQILRHSGIAYFRLMRIRKNTVYLLFRRNLLEEYLKNEKVCDILYQAGYRDFSLGAILRYFQTRYKFFTDREAGFPHEMGLLLGYPVEDVSGFIENKGENFLYSGYWKVYDDVPSKKKIFREYEEAQSLVIHLMAEKISLRTILELYNNDSSFSIAV